MMRALPPSFFVLPQWQLRFIWHSGCIISVCLPLLAILVRRSQASWACALQRRVGDFVPVTGHWNRLDALTWQVNAELLITGLDVYYNPDSLRCKARPFMTSQHVFRDVFLGCRMWENIGMAWHGQQWRLDSWWHRYNWCIRCSPVEYERHESWGRTHWAADHNDRSELAAGGRGGSCNLESFRNSRSKGPRGQSYAWNPPPIPAKLCDFVWCLLIFCWFCWLPKIWSLGSLLWTLIFRCHSHRHQGWNRSRGWLPE